MLRFIAVLWLVTREDPLKSVRWINFGRHVKNLKSLAT